MSCENAVPDEREAYAVCNTQVTDSLPDRPPGLSREARPRYDDQMDDLVFEWILEDLAIVAYIWEVEPDKVLADVLALIGSDTAALHLPAFDYAEAIRELLDWIAIDAEGIAKAFGLNPADVFVDAVRSIISDF